MLRTTNVRNGYVDAENTRYVTEETYSKWTRRLVPKRGDIILTREAPLGDVGKIRTDDKVFLGQRLYHFRPDLKKLDADFLLYSLLGDDLQSQIKGFGSGSTVEHMRLEDIPSLEFNVPPLPVQQRIAGILSAYDELIENSQRRIKILESMARALYREWFVHFRFPGHENHPRVASPLGEIPQGWEVKFAKDVATVTYGFPFQSGKFKTDSLGTPVIRIRDILAGASATFTEEGADPKYHVKNGHILVGMDGDFHMNIWSSGHAYQNQRVARFESKGEIGNFHLFLALEKPIQEFNKAIVGTTVAHLGDMHIKTIQIVWPPEDIRSKARAFLEPLSEQVIALKRQAANLRRTRDLLLPRLLSGQIEVEVA
jgi:type I restriction enzyme S subunit